MNKKQEISIEPRVGMVFGDLLTGYAEFLVKQKFYRDTRVLLSFLLEDTAPPAGATLSWA